MKYVNAPSGYDVRIKNNFNKPTKQLILNLKKTFNWYGLILNENINFRWKWIFRMANFTIFFKTRPQSINSGQFCKKKS